MWEVEGKWEWGKEVIMEKGEGRREGQEIKDDGKR